MIKEILSLLRGETVLMIVPKDSLAPKKVKKVIVSNEEFLELQKLRDELHLYHGATSRIYRMTSIKRAYPPDVFDGYVRDEEVVLAAKRILECCRKFKYGDYGWKKIIDNW